MLPKGPFQATDFKPDIPQDTLNRLNDQDNSQRMTARDYLDREQQEKEDYRKRRLRDEKEIVKKMISLHHLFMDYYQLIQYKYNK